MERYGLDKYMKQFPSIDSMLEYLNNINNTDICIIPNYINATIFDILYDISVDKENEQIRFAIYQKTLNDELINFKMVLSYSIFFKYINFNSYCIPNLVYNKFRYKFKSIIYRTDNMCKFFLDKNKNGKIIYDNNLSNYLRWLVKVGYKNNIERIKRYIFIDMTKSFDYYTLHRIISIDENNDKIRLETIVIYYNNIYGKEYIYSIKKYYSDISFHYMNMIIRNILNKEMMSMIIEYNSLYKLLSNSFGLENIFDISKIRSLHNECKIIFKPT